FSFLSNSSNSGTRFPIFAVGVLILVASAALLGPLITPHDPGKINLPEVLNPPVWMEGGTTKYLLGTDNLGRDILSRIIDGARVSVMVAFYAIVLSGLIGSLAGMTAGFFGGWVDSVISRLIDVQMSVPSLALAMLLASVLGPSEGIVVLIIVLT
ncbi:MAG TPA: peptide ABC transporter permease, partial [Gammaproteobacteria bacterium]|nr:peptide ABC transporter permease [Gammaproteobacteria bacterium]